MSCPSTCAYSSTILLIETVLQGGPSAVTAENWLSVTDGVVTGFFVSLDV